MKKTIRATKTAREFSIVNGQLFCEDAFQANVDTELFKEILGDGYTKAVRVISLDTAWYLTEWIDFDSKVNSDINVQMTLRREIRSGRGHWYAYRRVFNKLHKRYVANDDNITQKRLLDVARSFPAF